MKSLSRKAQVYILFILLGGALLAVGQLADYSEYSWGIVAVLSGLASLSLIYKVIGATDRSHYNFSFLVYGFSFVLLGVPATIIVIIISNIVEWIWHKYAWYIQSFNIASYIVGITAAGLVSQLLNPLASLYTLQGVIAVVVALTSFTVANHFLIGFVVWLARGENLRQSGLLNFLPFMIDFTLLSMGAGTALVWLVNPFGAVLVLMPVYLVYMTLRVPQLERKSVTDSKTGLYNSEYFQRKLEEELSRAHRFDRPLTVVMADMDHLRNINNAYGHVAGDEVLIAVAGILRESVRDYDVVARFGGEEFAFVMPEANPESVFARIETMRERIAQTDFQVSTSVTPVNVTISFGIAGREDQNQSVNALLHTADIALYHSKLKGRNHTSIYADGGVQSGFVFPAPKARLAAVASPQTTPEFPVVLKPVQLQQEKQESTVQKTEERHPTKKDKHPVSWLEKKSIPIYIASLSAFVLVLLYATYPPRAPVDLAGLIVFGLLVVLTEWLSIDIYFRDTAVSTSAVILLAGILLFRQPGALVLSLAIAVTALIKHRSPLSRFFFNLSNQLSASLICLVVISLTGMDFTRWPLGFQVLMSAPLAGLLFVITSFQTAVAIHLNMNLPVRQVWKEQFSWLLPYYLSMGIAACALFLSYQYLGFLGIGVILLPLLLLRFSQKQFIDRTRHAVSELKQKNEALKETALEISSLNDSLLDTLAEVIELRDPYVLGHSKQVTRYAVLIAEQLRLSHHQIERIRNAGLLHDVGKIGIPSSILRKPTQLTKEEVEIIKTHPEKGAEILRKSKALENLIPLVLHHHEQFDGKGYPKGLKGSEIPLEARILAVADTVEAMGSDRTYHKAMAMEIILAELKKQSGRQFDPAIVQAFLELVKIHGEKILINTATPETEDQPAQVKPAMSLRSVRATG